MVVVGHVNEKGAIPVTRGTPLGNPFPMNHPGERDLVCDKYEEWFKARLDDPAETEFKSYLNRILDLSRKRLVVLGCVCNSSLEPPHRRLRCHADTIKRWIDQQLGI